MPSAFSVSALLLIASLLGQPAVPSRLPPPGKLFHHVGTLKPSPSTLAVAATRFDHTGTHTLDLLVIWKGPADWHSTARSGHSGSGGGTGQWFEYTVRLEQRELKARLDSISRIAQIQQRRVRLETANVVLVDEIDSPSGPRVVRLLRIDPQVAADDHGLPALGDVWKRSPEIVAFVNR